MENIKDKVVTVESLSALHEYDKRVYATKVAMQEQYNNSYMLDNYGIPINTNDDLDDYITPGVFSATPDVAETLVNCPVKESGFKLVVERGYNKNYIIHTIYTSYADSVYADSVGISPTYSRKMTNDVWDIWARPLTNILYQSDYGTELPDTGVKGQIFFKKLNE